MPLNDFEQGGDFIDCGWLIDQLSSFDQGHMLLHEQGKGLIWFNSEQSRIDRKKSTMTEKTLEKTFFAVGLVPTTSRAVIRGDVIGDRPEVGSAVVAKCADETFFNLKSRDRLLVGDRGQRAGDGWKRAVLEVFHELAAIGLGENNVVGINVVHGRFGSNSTLTTGARQELDQRKAALGTDNEQSHRGFFEQQSIIIIQRHICL